MRPRIIFFVASAGVFLGSTALALKLEHSHRVSRQTLKENSTEVARSEHTLRSTEARLAEAVSTRTHAQRALETLRAKAAAAPSVVPKKEASASLVDPVRAALLNDPKMQNLQLRPSGKSAGLCSALPTPWSPGRQVGTSGNAPRQADGKEHRPRRGGAGARPAA